jgi:hypothetical protein
LPSFSAMRGEPAAERVVRQEITHGGLVQSRALQSMPESKSG